MILSDRDIQRRLLNPNDLRIDGLIDPELQIQPASVDLRLADSFQAFKPREPWRATLKNPEMSEAKLTADWASYMLPPVKGPFTLKAGQFALTSTVETLHMPDDLVARIEGRSSLGRIGLMVHVTAGFIDPGFQGQVTLELYNLNPYDIILDAGVRICQVSFHQMSSPAARPYGVERGSKYQGQVGVTASRMHGDSSSKSVP